MATKRLGRASLMEGVDKQIIENLVAEARFRSMSGIMSGLLRVQKDELSQYLFFVLVGEMHMFRFTPEGQEQLVQRFRAGEFFCLSALVSGCPCKSFLRNFGATELLVWNREGFLQQMSNCPRMYRNILHQMALQVENERELRSMSRCLRAEVRVAAYLRYQTRSLDNKAIDLRPVAMAAQEMGICRETLSRVLKYLQDRGNIIHRRGVVQITDKTWLESVLKDFNYIGRCKK